jgi:hypothetical protein
MNEEEQAAVARIEKHGEWMLGPDHWKQLRQFMAFVYANPGDRVRWCYLLIGPKGCGKTFFGNLMRAAIGHRNVRDVGQSSLSHSEFNSWAAGAQLNLIEEIKVDGTRKWDIMNALKSVITNDYIDVHRKGLDPTTEPNTASYLAFTNHYNAIAIDDYDRRYYVCHTRFSEVKQFINDLGGVEGSKHYFTELFGTLRFDNAIRGWLLATDMTGFDSTRAINTDEAKDLALSSQTDLESCVRMALSKPTKRYNRDAIEMNALKSALSLMEDSQMPSGQALGRLLRDMGYKAACKGREINPFNDEQYSRWYIKNHIQEGANTAKTIRELMNHAEV